MRNPSPTNLLRWIFLVTAVLFSASPTRADVRTPSGKVIECYCTDRYGQRHELGDIICLTVGGRSYMAKCAMAQNVPIWRDQKRGCLSSQKSNPSSDHAFMTPRPNVSWGDVLANDFKSRQMCG